MPDPIKQIGPVVDRIPYGLMVPDDRLDYLIDPDWICDLATAAAKSYLANQEEASPYFHMFSLWSKVFPDCLRGMGLTEAADFVSRVVPVAFAKEGNTKCAHLVDMDTALPIDGYNCDLGFARHLSWFCTSWSNVVAKPAWAVVWDVIVNRTHVFRCIGNANESVRNCVYFLGEEGTSLVKIGKCSGNLRGRMKTLQVGNPRRLYVRALLTKTQSDCERAAHRHFSDFRVSGEWFNLSDEQISDFMDVKWLERNMV